MERINFDSQFCGKVPLHQTNLIQPQGAMLVVDRSTLQIIQASENISDIIKTDIRDIIGHSVSEFIASAENQKLYDKINRISSGKLSMSLKFRSFNYLTFITILDKYFIIEIDNTRAKLNDESFISVYEDIKSVMTEIDAADSITDVFEIVLSELKRISGFDKIMIYKFDEDWNGEVVAEVKEPGMDSYLHLKFPASDIPKQARELYKRSAYRLIPDVDYKPVKLYPVLNSVTNTFTDLSNSNYRSVAGVHLEYLKNMNVKASMSTRILVNNKLWGLISCHHRNPKFLSFEICSAFELISNVISAKITSLINKETFNYKSLVQSLYSRIVEDAYRENLLFGITQHKDDLLKVLNVKGLSVVRNNIISSFGNVPDNHEILNLIEWLQAKNFDKIYYQNNLSSIFEPARAFAKKASGLLSLPVEPDKGYFILAFRPEAVQNVQWGGNPNEAIQFEEDGKTYHPRNSFRIWKQTFYNTSLPWKPEEIEVAEQLKNFVLEYTLNNVYK